jgi:hypothetical protein
MVALDCGFAAGILRPEFGILRRLMTQQYWLAANSEKEINLT